VIDRERAASFEAARRESQRRFETAARLCGGRDQRGAAIATGSAIRSSMRRSASRDGVLYR